MNFNSGKHFFNRNFSKSFMNNKNCFKMFNSFANGNKFKTSFSNKLYFNKMVFFSQCNSFADGSIIPNFTILSSTSGSEIMKTENSIVNSIFCLGK